MYRTFNKNIQILLKPHFYNFSDRGVNEISNESFLYPFIFFIYEEKIFNKRRQKIYSPKKIKGIDKKACDLRKSGPSKILWPSNSSNTQGHQNIFISSKTRVG
jgi:hypothetical protein